MKKKSKSGKVPLVETPRLSENKTVLKVLFL